MIKDASQTLYEFRASNPKALNALEESGVFDTYSLTTNYRSNQSILDFANRSLATIEANQYARIQLQANLLSQQNAKEFTEKVTLDYRFMHRPATEFKAYLPAYLKNVVRPWIDGCLDKGEQVAFLAYDRATVSIMQKELQQMYPNREVISLVSERAYATTVFSDFIKKYWDQITQIPDTAQAAFGIQKVILSNLASLVRDPKKSETPIKHMLSKWWTESRDAITAWVMLNKAKQLSDDDFFDRLQRNLLDFEIAHNSSKQSLLNQKNKERKEQNLHTKADLIVSTIHGVKGLEFDNVAIMYRAENDMDEATKRMYYVALTRAINTEYILAYGSLKNPKIVADYDLVIADIVNQERIEKLRAQGNDPLTMSDDEVEAALALMEQRARDAFDAGDTKTAMELMVGDIEYSTTGEELNDDTLAQIASDLADK